MKSRIDFFLVVKHLSRHDHKADIESSIAPEHNLIYVPLQWENETARGPGFWKFNNNLLKGENYIRKYLNCTSYTKENIKLLPTSKCFGSF